MADRVVYDSENGPLTCPRCGKRADRCTCGPGSARGKAPPQSLVARSHLPQDGVVRVLRDRSHRGGKTVTVVAGLTGSAAEIERLTGELKRSCGSGGTVKGAVVEIQGDHRERIADLLRARGWAVKLAGG